jgi:serine/threonine protein kinase/Leucine-rich repeat (LRR) protein
VNLELSRNKGLTGPLPKELGSLVNLQYLSIQWCNLIGSIPVELGDLPQLVFLALNGNQLSSSIPSSFGKLTNLTWLDVSTNNLTGSIPVSSSSGSNGIGLDNMTSIKHFHFNANLLSGAIPEEIFLLQFLVHIIFDHNNFTSLPTGVGKAPSLLHMVLENNQLTGPIPQEIGSVKTLQRLTLNNNLFSGALPDFSNLTNLEYLDASNNHFSQQSFPSWVESLSNLATLNLAQDNIVGPINSSVFSISQLQSLNLSHNQITGQLDFTGNATLLLQSVDVTQNSISGFSGKPEFNGVLLQDVQLMLEGNPVCSNPYLSFSNFSCGINSPQFFWTPTPNASCSSVNCKNNEQLNRKTCACAYPLQITVVLTSPTFSNLTDARALNIETEIADQMTSIQFITLDPSQVVIDSGSNTGNGQYQLNLLFFPLVGDSLSTNNQTEIVTVFNQRRITLVEGPFQVPGHPFINQRGGISLSPGAIAGIVIGVSVLLLTGLITALYAIRQKIRADKAVANHPFASWGAGGKEFGDAPKLKGARWFSLAELKLATGDWSRKNELGRGGYGIVYKGILKSGDIVAIKRAQGKSMQGAAEFKNEIELLSRVHHRNLVGLVGFCYEHGEQALIYEYMSNGTLREYLYGKSRAPFSWQERLNIVLGSARGIAYLHDHANPPIIHRDVKTSNILLNDRKAAKVADFGLSKLAPEEGEMRVYSSNVKGTMGYLDPEYYTTFKLTDKSDVYSFGIVLIELLTARPPIVNGKFVVREVKTALDRGGLASLRPLLEPAVQDLPDAELQAFLNVALKCVEDSSADRDSIAQVVKQLEDLGTKSNANGDMHSFDIEFGSLKPLKKFDDNDVVFPSSAGTEKGANGSNPFHYSGNVGVSTNSRF